MEFDLDEKIGFGWASFVRGAIFGAAMTAPFWVLFCKELAK